MNDTDTITCHACGAVWEHYGPDCPTCPACED